MRIASLLLALVSACNVVTVRERTLRARAHRAGLRDTIVATGHDEIHVWRGGKGPPVLLLHGFGASALWQWHAQIDAFAQQHELVIPDLLGFGGSSSPGDDPSLDHQASAMIGVLDALEIDRVDIIGISYGGMVAYLLAGTHPERVGKLVLVGSPGHAWSAGDHEAMLERLGISAAKDLFVPSSADDIRALTALAYARPRYVPGWAARQAIAALYDPHRADQDAMIERLGADIDVVATGLSRPRAPALVVWGVDDPVFPVATGTRLARELGARMVVIEKARHFVNEERPRAFNDAVLDFLR